MCGILGYSGRIDDYRQATFKRALDSIKHRGPDGHLIWQDNGLLLGHRRLSIIDLLERALQPMIDKASGLAIVFNGEIYNYIEIKKELEAKGHKFITTSDTEVLLKGYIEWGADVLTRCNGMWAFAIWDPRSQELFMARDRFGKKPFYYAHKGQSFAFASEPKALHALDPDLKEPNTATILNFIRESSLHAGARTFYQNISALPPAHYAVYNQKQNSFTLHRYWDYPIAEENAETGNYHETFEELFNDAVRLRLRADVKVGLTLSGGLDSSSILAAYSKFEPNKMNCYTSVFSDSVRSEEKWAVTAANLADAKVEPVQSNLDNWLDVMNKAIHHLDSPGTAPAVLPLWSIMARARQDNVPVLLEGQGADELLAGYAPYYAIATLAELRTGHIGAFLKSYKQMRQSFTPKWSTAWLLRKSFPNLASWYRKGQRNLLINPEITQSRDIVTPDKTLSTSGNGYDPLRAALWRDHSSDILPNLLHYGDSISMAHGIETRLPFMDHRLVEWSFKKRPPLLEGKTKTLVREYLHRQNFDAIANRPDKAGYPTPMLEWFKSQGSDHLSQIMSEPSAQVWDIMDRKGVKKLGEQAKAGGVLAIFHLYKVITLDLWLRQLKFR